VIDSDTHEGGLFMIHITCLLNVLHGSIVKRNKNGSIRKNHILHIGIHIEKKEHSSAFRLVRAKKFSMYFHKILVIYSLV